jgi:hypothetical protein
MDGGVTYLGIFKIAGEDIVFVGVESKGVWCNAGGSWMSVFPSSSDVLTMAQDPSQPRTLYVGVKAGGMYRSLSAGE